MRAWFALALTLAAPALARPADREAVVQVVKDVVEGENAKDSGTIGGSTWPEARFRFGPSGPWVGRDQIGFHGTGVFGETRLGHPAVVIGGSRALVTVTERERIYYDTAGGRDGLYRAFSGQTFVGRDRVELEKRRNEWRVLSWERTGRTIGSDAAWHRQHSPGRER